MYAKQQIDCLPKYYWIHSHLSLLTWPFIIAYFIIYLMNTFTTDFSDRLRACLLLKPGSVSCGKTGSNFQMELCASLWYCHSEFIPPNLPYLNCGIRWLRPNERIGYTHFLPGQQWYVPLSKCGHKRGQKG